MPRTIRLDDLDDPIVQHALIRYQRTHPRLDADGITELIVRAALADLADVLTVSAAAAADERTSIDAALATTAAEGAL